MRPGKDLDRRLQSHHSQFVLVELVEQSHGNKKGIIHDATCGTKINNRIKCRDKHRSPGAREKSYLLDFYNRRMRVVFNPVGDISKAHRRFLHHPSERGLLACKVLSTDNFHQPGWDVWGGLKLPGGPQSGMGTSIGSCMAGPTGDASTTLHFCRRS